MASYYHWISQAQRWQRCVDFASPMTAWTDAMFKEAEAARRENRPPSMANVRNSKQS